ncbi:FIST signal transduction protein [Oligoflexus tunisiensis]|uniref:FIST signal transduction protein n=1 Tax=Oligoflexus tunisiensis TaxID=708132 RepID=UPI000AB6D709|nr:FIST N-terminal domain-containing protein [Oligoflexus tunisiensis]
MTKVGVGFSDHTDSMQAAREACNRAQENLGQTSCDLVFVISTSRHVPELVMEGIRQIFPDPIPVVGGYGVGIITNTELAYDGYQLGLALFSLKDMSLGLEYVHPITDAEFSKGQQLGQAILERFPGAHAMLLFYDSVNRLGEQLRLNMATPLLQGLKAAMGDACPQIAGAGLVGDMQCQNTWQWCGQSILQHSAIALIPQGNVQLDTVIMHGCKPASSYHAITRVDGPVVLEIDHKPALDFIAEALGPESGKTWRDYAFFLTLGMNTAGRWQAFDENAYVNRLCMKVDKKRGGLVMFEPFKPGDVIQVMRRSMDLSYISRKIQDHLAKLQDRHIFFALYIDCAGRASAYSGMDIEEASEVQKSLGSDIPLLGFYSGVEIAEIQGEAMGLDWTGVLCLFSQAR